jgi:hypothetical protein
MSPVEMLEQVVALPARERERFLLALFKLEGKPTHAKPKSRRVKWPDIEARTKRIFGERMFPNLELLERGKPKFVVRKSRRPKMTRKLAEARAVGSVGAAKFDGTAFLGSLKRG